MSDPLYVGTVQPPADMMEAARLSLTPTGFENLMARTGGRIPTPAELVEFADAERLAQEAAAPLIDGAIDATAGQVGALLTGNASGGKLPAGEAYLVGEPPRDRSMPP